MLFVCQESMALVVAGSLVTLLVLSDAETWARGARHPMAPRVPADKLEEARALVNPLPDSFEIVEKGKAIYEGKGTCVNCHGVRGSGDGPGGMNLDPPPRDFRHRGWWRHRTEGELFWVIKHGSPGTGMIPFGGLLSDEEIWAVLRYERGFAGRRGRMGPPCCDERPCRPRIRGGCRPGPGMME